VAAEDDAFVDRSRTECIAAQLWNYKYEAWTQRLFDNWRASLIWRRCKPDNKASLGFVEASITKSASSNDAPTGYATKTAFASRSSLTFGRRSDRPCFC
jgi:hypothetical protein